LERQPKETTKSAVNASKSAVKYLGDHEKDILKAVKKPIIKSAILGATSLVAPELDPLVSIALSAAGKPKKSSK
jgi:hypothetical protein